jgi:hypothetical protein
MTGGGVSMTGVGVAPLAGTGSGATLRPGTGGGLTPLTILGPTIPLRSLIKTPHKRRFIRCYSIIVNYSAKFQGVGGEFLGTRDAGVGFSVKFPPERAIYKRTGYQYNGRKIK